MYKNKIVYDDLNDIIKNNFDFNKLKNRSVMITGATGMLASYVMFTLMYLNDLKKLNIKIYPLVRNKEKLEKMISIDERTDVFPIIQDVCEKIFFPNSLDYIFHMASSANPKTITSNPIGIIKANAIGTFNVLELAKEKGAEVLFTSTREIYGKMPTDCDKITETDIGSLHCDELRACYPESKRLAETLLVSYAYQYGVNYKVARIAHSYGPGMIIDNDGRIMSDLISNVIRGEDIILKSDGSALRAFCYVSDAVSALFTILLSDKTNNFFNVANETEELSIKELAFLLKDLSHNDNIHVAFNIKDNNNQYVTFKRTRLDISKLENIGWKPKVLLKNGLCKTIKYFKDNTNN